MFSIADRKVTIPGYIVQRGEEDNIAINPLSAVADEMHPIRQAQKGAIEARARREAAQAAYREREERGGGRGGRGGDRKKFVKKVAKPLVAEVAEKAEPAALDVPEGQ